jgi:hypothetical protein
VTVPGRVVLFVSLGGNLAPDGNKKLKPRLKELSSSKHKQKQLDGLQRTHYNLRLHRE